MTRVFSGFKYKTGINHTGTRELLPIPCKVGNVSRIVGAINRANSENVALTAPFISVWISNISVARNRTINPTYESQIAVTERKYDYTTGKYTNQAGNSYMVERLAPVPYDVTIQVDIWSTNEDMKLQILEQILLLFNPSIEWQKNENPLDWTSMSMLELENINYSSRSVPVSNDDAMEITSLTFQVKEFYLNPPAKIKKQKLINTIIQNTFVSSTDMDTWDHVFTNVTTYQNANVFVDNNEVTISSFNGDINWNELLDKNGHSFEEGLYRLRLYPNYGIDYLTAPIILNLDSISSTSPEVATFTVNQNSLPATTFPAINGIINPNELYPGNNLDTTTGRRYIITNNIIPNTEAWGAFSAPSGSIIESVDGINFDIVLNSQLDELGNIVRNTVDDELYVQVDKDLWTHIYRGTYKSGYWRLVTSISGNKSI